MTFKEFCEEISDGVLSCVPSARYHESTSLKGPASVGFGGAKATISREEHGWLVAFSGPGGAAKSTTISGEKMTPATAANVAQSIVAFLT
jgi:hypothetical protein